MNYVKAQLRHAYFTKFTKLEAFLGFLVKTKMKAYKKLTVVMCCQIVARKSVVHFLYIFCT